MLYESRVSIKASCINTTYSQLDSGALGIVLRCELALCAALLGAAVGRAASRLRLLGGSGGSGGSRRRRRLSVLPLLDRPW